jgi:hypothetical protein
MAVEYPNESTGSTTETIKAPAPTAWPIVLAFGVTLVFAGMVTSGTVSVLGAILSLAAVVGWFRDVLPHEAHEEVPVEAPAPVVVPVGRVVAHAEIGEELKRAWLPLEIHPISAGVKGGLAGSVAMAALAMLYGIVSGNGIWYPINLLAAGFMPSSMTETTAQLAAFNFTVLLIAIPIHLITSLLVGLLYGAMLPMLPRRPILLGGFIAPLMWSGLIYGILDVVNPVLNQRIHWVWFVLSQMGFGIVAGLVVSRTQKIPTAQRMPFALMMETPGIMEEHGGEEGEGQ